MVHSTDSTSSMQASSAQEFVFEGKTRSGKPLLVRYLKESDAPLLLDYFNTLSQEQTFITFQGEQQTLEQEVEYIAKALVSIQEKKTVLLLALSGNSLVGVTDIKLQNRVSSHVGVFGLTVAREFRSDGVGSILMDTVLKEAEEHMPSLRIIKLGVFGNNGLAREMYERRGFKEYGRLPEGVLHRGQHVDHIEMYKKVR